jgi:hypothetical protein
MLTHRREEKHIQCLVGKPKRKRAIGDSLGINARII